MPIKAITGTPGAGKTLSMLEELCKAVGIDPRKFRTSDELIDALRNRSDPRLIFVCNVEGLQPGIFETLDDPLDWENCPDGSLIAIDEVWQFLGSHLPAAKNDSRVLNLAKHRHRGFDFIFTMQQPGQLSSFVRGLVGEHVHVSRRFGTQITERFQWPAMCDDPNSVQQRKRGSGGIPWTYPPTVMGLYQSATVHTVKRKLPLRVVALPLLALAFVALMGLGAWKVYKMVTPKEAAPAAAAQRSEQGAPAVPTSPQPQSTPKLTAAEWAERQTPRVAEMPWSAPIFDGRQAHAEPRLLCYISYRDSDDGECKCFTEQATRYYIADESCRRVARDGEPYNPYRRPGRILTTDSGQPAENIGGSPGLRRTREPSGRPGAVDAAATPGAVIAGDQVTAYGDIGVGATARPTAPESYAGSGEGDSS
ncbi:zonular occludens toxin domain-containing protein [Lysobacter firmicutimachus]|uniref:Zonular occludens toxin domain-containing protein n=1 Tax=Lysobacter firmicutimachus TaxID=1792846 RepID=A0ABU8D4V6_9GAMM